MLLDVATRLRLRDHRTDEPASLVDVACLCGHWAGHPDPESLLESGRWPDVGHRKAEITTVKWDLGAGNAWAWSMRCAHPDSADPSVLWVVEASAVEDPSRPDTEVTVTLARESRSSTVRAFRTDRPAPPRLIHDLVNAPGLECLDGTVPLSPDPATLRRAVVEEFVSDLLLSRERSLPVIGVSLPPDETEPSVDPQRLAKLLAGMAHVWVIPPDTTWALSSALPPRLGVYNGAIRLWWPGLNSGSRPAEHRLWHRDADRVDLALSLEVIQTARARHRPLEALARVRAELDERARQAHEAEVAELFELLEQSTAAAPEAAAGRHAASALQEEVKRLRQHVAALEAYEESYVAEIERMEQLIKSVGDNAEALRDRLNTVQWENRSLKSQLASAGMSPGASTSTGDAATSFIQEVQASYARRYTAHDQETYPLGEILLHPDFLAALDKLDIDRTKVLDVCADVASGRAKKVDARQVHQLRTGDSGAASARVRATDGATAWRCSLQHKTPSARRLHWWAIPGGAVEFAHVGLHDDMTCPE